MEERRRISIYGGTFDPVHSGHIEIAKGVSQLLDIQEVLFVPALLAPHKLQRNVTSHLHRYAMLVLATANDPGLKVSTFELEAANRRYTVDTVAHFQETFVGSTDLFFIMGTDSWSEITTWREWERLLSMTNVVVVTRPGFDVRQDHVPPAVRESIVDLRGISDKTKQLPGQPAIFITDVVMMNVSATDIRQAVRENRLPDLEGWVPRPVAQYIEKYSLYRDLNEA